MRDVDHRSSSRRSRHKSRSKSRDRDRDRDYYSRRRRRSKSRSRTSKPKKKKSKKKRYRRSSSSSGSTTSSRSSKTSGRSRGSMRSSGSGFRYKSQTTSTEKYSSATLNKVTQKVDLNLPTGVPDKSTLDNIEEDTFTAKPFISTAENKKIPEKVIIDLKNDTISVEVKEASPEKPQLIHPDFLGDPTRKLDKWVKKLYNYRQKAFQE